MPLRAPAVTRGRNPTDWYRSSKLPSEAWAILQHATGHAINPDQTQPADHSAVTMTTGSYGMALPVGISASAASAPATATPIP